MKNKVISKELVATQTKLMEAWDYIFNETPDSEEKASILNNLQASISYIGDAVKFLNAETQTTVKKPEA